MMFESSSKNRKSWDGRQMTRQCIPGTRSNRWEWFGGCQRSQVVSVGSDTSAVMKLLIGVPQGSVLGPRSLLYYAEDVQEIFEREEIKYHMFADDMQGHRSSQPQNAAMIVSRVQDCVVAVSKWCASKRLQLNAKKTELLWFGSVTELRKLDPSLRSLTVGTDVIQPVDVVRDLGVFDSHLTIKAHVARVARTCFFHLRRLRSIRRSLGLDVTSRLVSALEISRLDYCNSVLTHLPASMLAPLQRVLNAAVWLVHDLGPHEHVTLLTFELHWLPIAEVILSSNSAYWYTMQSMVVQRRIWPSWLLP